MSASLDVLTGVLSVQGRRRMANAAVSLPQRSLIVLCGPAGAGKSTFAGDIARRNGLATTAVVSSDACRLMLCDDTRLVTGAQWSDLQPMTFRLFLTIIDMRMSLGRPVLGDGVNLHAELRTELLGFARTHEYRNVLVVFDMSLKTCLTQNEQRAESHRIPERQIRAQRQALDEAVPRLADEGWDHVMVLNDRRRTVLINLDG
jgi:protein phosphatase